jgi:hypothetical protein
MDTYHSRAVRLRSIGKPRGAALAALVLVPIAGGAAGAGTHAQPPPSFQAQAILALDPAAALTATPRLRRQAADYMAQIVKLPEVVAGARANAQAEPSVAAIERGLRVVVEPGPDLIGIDVRADSASDAVTLADSLAVQAAGFVRQTVFTPNAGRIALSDFSYADGGWSRTSDLSSSPLTIGPVRRPGAAGAWDLQVACPAVASCGPAVGIDTGFLGGSTYRAEAWARSTAGARVRLVLGNTTTPELGIGAAQTLGPRWKLLTVSWTPRTDATTGELTTQTVSARMQTYDIGNVSLLEPTIAGLPNPARGAPDVVAAFQLARSVTLGPAEQIAERSDPWRTVGWAGIGALIGLAVVLAALGSAHAARRRQQAE